MRGFLKIAINFLSHYKNSYLACYTYLHSEAFLLDNDLRFETLDVKGVHWTDRGRAGRVSSNKTVGLFCLVHHRVVARSFVDGLSNPKDDALSSNSNALSDDRCAYLYSMHTPTFCFCSMMLTNCLVHLLIKCYTIEHLMP